MNTLYNNTIKMQSIKASLLFGLIVLMTINQAYSFCGFYVAKAGANLYNNKSEVIIVRDGKLTTLTMSNDFKGDVKDFAMVVPVPEVLRERDIKVVNRDIFDKIDAYSAPRMVEYYDDNPCGQSRYYWNFGNATPSSAKADAMDEVALEKKTGVTIQAKYTIGEYDILILSALESSGLETWLTTNGYALPENAKEVLQPYINDKLNFFVVKVNLEKRGTTGFDYLRPIQITYENDRFMLPIRLGMANAKQHQDLIVYTFTKNGRVECTNYRTEKMPTGNYIPTFVLNQFDSFYKKTFNKQYINNNRNTVFLEYAWNVTPSFNGMKCDPCVGNPPMLTEFKDAGVQWLNDNPNATVFFTRLHIRYRRSEFPQDLMFQVTPNTESYQARYVITHPATGVDCSEGKKYLQKLETRKVLEVIEYCKLTGDKPYQYAWYAPQLKNTVPEKDQGNVTPEIKDVIKKLKETDSISDDELKKYESIFIGNDDSNNNENTLKPLLLLLLPLSLLLISFVYQWNFKKRSKRILKIKE
ncbi:MAG: DUF2330 domain-containing protein [Bacteroidota bacterium]